MSGNPNLVMFLAANKADLEEKRKVGAEVLTIKYFLFFSYALELNSLFDTVNKAKYCPHLLFFPFFFFSLGR